MSRVELFIASASRPDIVAPVADLVLSPDYQPLALDGSGGGSYPPSMLSGCCESDGKEGGKDGKEGSDGKEDTSDGKEDSSRLRSVVEDLQAMRVLPVDLTADFVRVDVVRPAFDVRFLAGPR